MATDRFSNMRNSPTRVIRPKTKKTAYTPKSVIPGIPHVIEGAPKFSSVITQSETKRDMSYLSGGAQDMLKLQGRYDDVAYQKKEDPSVKAALDVFQRKQKARQRIAPIADPEAGQAERRRRAARRRMRGRLGTMLSERDTLG